MHSMKDAFGEALKRRKMKGMSQEDDEAFAEGESPEEEKKENRMADLAPEVKDEGEGGARIEIAVKPGVGNRMAADNISESGDMPDLSVLMGKDASPEEIAALAGASGKPKSLYDAASRALAQKKMKG